MENPEEILHSLEEFAKLKPKDIPRELEEYLKFVAKTGDPIYQWSAIKSLFREKFITVITEFYEACSSMEIPPCPNVDMFNYDLVKSFILEKLDTFASAPFTLQRICELLTSPRKEYTRIDKYMRALEKNILVVSTMEPGGRRTENGEGIMNGIESDHEHVPEPGNEINVEEMDESPYIQTSNHVTEHISFDNPKSSTDIEIENSVDTFTSDKIASEASTSSQDLVCVQYVSIEPITANTTNNTPNLIDETKEADVSVTITPVNVKDDSEVKPQVVELPSHQTETILPENVSGSTEALTEIINKPDIETEPVVHMETEAIESTEEMTKIECTEISTHPISEATPTSTTMLDKLSEEIDQPQITSESKTLLENDDSESVSPENSITSSDNSSCESSTDALASVEVLPSKISTEVVENSVEEPAENLEDQTVIQKSDNLTIDNSDAVDSTTKASGDSSIDSEVSNQCANESDKIEIPTEDSLESDTNCTEDIPEVQSTENETLDSNDIKETSVKVDAPTSTVLLAISVPVESSKTDEPNNTLEESECKLKEPSGSKIEEVTSLSDEIETRMEVDAVPESTSDINSKEETAIKEPESSQPPNP